MSVGEYCVYCSVNIVLCCNFVVFVVFGFYCGYDFGVDVYVGVEYCLLFIVVDQFDVVLLLVVVVVVEQLDELVGGSDWVCGNFQCVSQYVG